MYKIVKSNENLYLVVNTVTGKIESREPSYEAALNFVKAK